MTVTQTQGLHNKVFISSTGELSNLNEYAVDFLEQALDIVNDADFTDFNTQIKYTDAVLIDPDALIGDNIGRCYSPYNGQVILRWRYPAGITKSLYTHKIYRKKKGPTLQMKHSNGAFRALIEDPSAVKIYEADLTLGEFIDTFRLEPGQEYFYTSFLEDKSTGFAYNDAITQSPISTISVINRSEVWTGKDVLDMMPHEWKTKDPFGSNRAVCDMIAFRNDWMRDIVKHLYMYDNEKMLGKIVDQFVRQWSGLPPQTKLGIDTMRRQIGMTQSAAQWKSSRQGVIKFIRMLTTWQIGPNNIYPLVDTIPNEWFETWDGAGNGSVLWDSTYGPGEAPYPLFGPTTGTIGTTAEQVYFIEIPNVAIALGVSDNISYSTIFNSTILEDNKVAFNATNPLGAHLIPNQNNLRERFEITTYTPHELYIAERVNTAMTGDNYCVLTALDAQRLESLLTLLPFMLLFNVRPVIRFI